MTKKTAHIVTHHELKNMVLLNNKNKDLDVTHVVKHLFENDMIVNKDVKSVGFNCGSKNATQSDDFANSLVIANQSLKTSKTIGSNKNRNKFSITTNINI